MDFRTVFFSGLTNSTQERPSLTEKGGQQDKVCKLTAMIRKVGEETMRRMMTRNHAGLESTERGARPNAASCGQSSCGHSACSLAKVLVSLIKVVLDVSQEEAFQIAGQRCAQIKADMLCSM